MIYTLCASAIYIMKNKKKYIWHDEIVFLQEIDTIKNNKLESTEIFNMAHFSTMDRARIYTYILHLKLHHSSLPTFFVACVTTSCPHSIWYENNELTESLLLDWTCFNNSGQLTCL